MEKIINSSDIVIGEEYLLDEEPRKIHSPYFIEHPTRVKISEFDGTHFWTKYFDVDNLTEPWKDYRKLCISAPEHEKQNGCVFYRLEPATK